MICSLLFSLHGPRSLTLAHGLGRSEGQLINTDPGRQKIWSYSGRQKIRDETHRVPRLSSRIAPLEFLGAQWSSQVARFWLAGCTSCIVELATAPFTTRHTPCTTHGAPYHCDMHCALGTVCHVPCTAGMRRALCTVCHWHALPPHIILYPPVRHTAWVPRDDCS